MGAAVTSSIVSVLAVLAGCDGSSGPTLYVDLRTDLVLGEDFARVETLLADEPIGASTEARRVESTPADGTDFVLGARVAELDSVTKGTHYARVSLVGADGRVAVSRDVVVDVQGDLAITVVVSRRCESILCPGADDPPSHTACSSGRCVDPRCTPETPAFCGEPECNADSECPEPAGCLAPLCGEGVCLAAPSDAACGAGSRCLSDGTCVVRPDGGPPRMDGGVPRIDGGPPRTDGGPPGTDGGPPRVDSGFDAGPMLSSTFCPAADLRREQAALFLVRYMHGTSFVPPPAAGTFSDVSSASPYAPFIEQLARDGITAGCAPSMFCPTASVTRGQGATLFGRAFHGASFMPPPATGTVFTDVMTTTAHAAFIEQLARDGITTGCGSGMYCPDYPLSRAQAAIFIVRMQHGASYTPPPATGLFTDVPAGLFEAPFIEQFVRDGYAVGCGT